ncbi:hypothetical protein D3C72_2235750 [compost metagenome]
MRKPNNNSNTKEVAKEVILVVLAAVVLVVVAIIRIFLNLCLEAGHQEVEAVVPPLIREKTLMPNCTLI